MGTFTDPLTEWAFAITLSVLAGTALLILVAFLRRWQQSRQAHYVHAIRRQYRPVLAALLRDAQNSTLIATLRALPVEELELLFDPLFSRRKVPACFLPPLRALCLELGLVERWREQISEYGSALKHVEESSDRRPSRPRRSPVIRARGIRNLGKLRHAPSWPLLIQVLDDSNRHLQLLALRALGTIRAPASFPVLRHRLEQAALGWRPSPPVSALRAAMARYDPACLPALIPALRHGNRYIRAHAAEVLRTVLWREVIRLPRHTLTSENLTTEVMDLLFFELSVDPNPTIRARVAQAIVCLADLRVTPVLRDLLVDPHWLVRLRALQALAQFRSTAKHLMLDIRQRLGDPHWRVRSAAIGTLIAFGPGTQQQLYEYFLTCDESNTRAQIVEAIERTGLIAALAEAYSAGETGLNALMLEQLAAEAAPLGLAGILGSLSPDVRQRFLDRLLLYAQDARHLGREEPPNLAPFSQPQRALEFPTWQVA